MQIHEQRRCVIAGLHAFREDVCIPCITGERKKVEGDNAWEDDDVDWRRHL